MPNYSYTVHVPCNWYIRYIDEYISSLVVGSIPVATELHLRVQLAANAVINAFNALNDPALQLTGAPAGGRILYVFTLPEFFFRTMRISGFDLLDADTRAALSLAPIPPIPVGSTADIHIPATDSRMACTNIGLQVATELTTLIPPDSPIHAYLMDSVLILGSAVMYAGHYSFKTMRTGRKVDNLAIVLRLSAAAADAPPTWSVHLTWKILNSSIDTMKSENETPDTGFGQYAPATGQLQRATALSRTFMHGATIRTDTGKVRSHSLEKHTWDQLKKSYLEAQFLGPTQPPPHEYLTRAATAASQSEGAQNYRMALEQLGLDSVRAQRGMEENAGNGTWLTTPGPALPSGFLQLPDALTFSGLPIILYIEICLDHKLKLFRFLSAFRPSPRVNIMVLISLGLDLKPFAFTDLPPNMDNFVVCHNDGGGRSVHTRKATNGVLSTTNHWLKTIDRTTYMEAKINEILQPPKTIVSPPLKRGSVLIGFSNMYPI